MAGIFGTLGYWTCGFDFLPSSLSSGGVWDTVSSPAPGISGGSARFAGQGMQLTAGISTFAGRSFGVNLPTTVVGFAFKVSALPASTPDQIAVFYDATANANQVWMCVTSTGQIGFYTGTSSPTTLLGTATGIVISPNTYYYGEVLLTVATSGQIIFRLNGQQLLNFTANTKFSANAYCNRFYLQVATGNHFYDDVYILDTTAPAPLNTFLGPVRVQTDGPNADSATAGLNQWAFTSPQGTDWGNAANIPANAAQSNFDATVGDRMSFRYPTLSTQVLGLNMWYSGEIDAAGTRAVVPIYRNAGRDQVGPSPGNLASSFTYYNQACIADPNTGILWASGPQGAANTCELGLQVST